MSIHSGLTKSMTEEIKKIYDAEDHGVDFMDWDGFLDSFEQLSHADPDKQIDMLGSLLLRKPAPAYRYLTYALLELFQGDSLTLSQFREKAEQVFAEAEASQNANTAARYKQPLLKELTDLVFNRMVENGFSSPEKNTEITVQLWSKQSGWTRKQLCEILFSNKPMTKNKLKAIDTSKAKETFFALSLGLSFDISFVQDYLKRVLHAPELNVWDIKEVLVYVLLKNPSQTNNPYASYRKLLDQYENAEPAAPAQTGEQQTEEVKGLMEQLANALLATSPDSSDIQSLLSQYKYLMAQQQENVQKDWNAVNARLEEAKSLTAKQKEDSPEKYGSAREEKVAAWEHLHTANRLFLALRNSVENKLKDFELEDDCDDTYKIADAGIIGKFIYGFPYDALMADEEHPVNHALFADLFAPILKDTQFSPAQLTGISHGKEVSRERLMTMAFLDRALDFDSPTRQSLHTDSYGISVLKNILLKHAHIEDDEDFLYTTLDSFRNDYMNPILRQAGFDELYCMNPFDCMLMYLSLLDTPFAAYCYISSICKQQVKEADK